jgi:hypothetical protein
MKTIFGRHTGLLSILDAYDNAPLEEHPGLVKKEKYESKEDILVLAAACRRLAKEGANFTLTDPSVYKRITEEDRAKALEIREYYKRKLTWSALSSDRPESGFRTDLGKILNSDGKSFEPNDCKVAYYMPDFYEYDMTIEELKSKVVSAYINENPHSFDLCTLELTPELSLANAGKRKRQEYWFKDDKNRPAVIQINTPNPLLNVWERLFQQSKSVSIRGRVLQKTRDGFKFSVIANWELVDNQ